MVKVGSSVYSPGQHRMTRIDPKDSGMLQKHYISIIIRVRDDNGASGPHSGHPGGIRDRSERLRRLIAILGPRAIVWPSLTYGVRLFDCVPSIPTIYQEKSPTGAVQSTFSGGGCSKSGLFLLKAEA